MERLLTAAAPLLMLSLLAACEVRDSEDDSAEQAAQAPEATEHAAPAAEPSAGAPSVPAEQVPSPPHVGGSPTAPPAKMQKLGEMLGRAAQAADEASAEGASNCERAYAGATAMARALGEQMGQANPEASLPPRDSFLSACNDLPEDVQRCMIVSYSIQHQAECRRVRQENEALMRRVREIMGQGQHANPAQGRHAGPGQEPHAGAPGGSGAE